MNTARFTGLRRLLTGSCWLPALRLSLALCPYGYFPRQRPKAIAAIRLFLCFLAAPLFAQFSYAPYPVLFNRTTDWAQKEPLLKHAKGKGEQEDEGVSKGDKRTGKGKKQE